MAVTIKGFASDWSVPEPAKAGLDAVSAGLVNDPGSGTNEALIVLFGSLLSDKAPVTPGLIALGDSITLGTSIPGSAHGNAWPTYAGALSNQALRLIRNSGVGGDRTDQMIARFGTDVTPRNPEIVSLLAGSNDLMQDAPHETIRANIRELVSLIRGIGAEPILCTVPPRINGGETLVREHNRWVRGYAAVEGLRLVDMFEVLADGDGWKAGFDSGDGTHPSAAGYRAMGEKFHEQITPDLDAPFDPQLTTVEADATNIVTNGVFASGSTWPTGWTRVGNTANFTEALEAGPVGNWRVLNVTTGGSPCGLQQVVAVSAGKYAPGNRVRFAARVQSPQGGNMNISAVFGGGSGGTFQAARELSQALDGVVMLEFTVPAGVTSATFYLTASAVGMYKVGQYTARVIS